MKTSIQVIDEVDWEAASDLGSGDRWMHGEFRRGLDQYFNRLEGS